MNSKTLRLSLRLALLSVAFCASAPVVGQEATAIRAFKKEFRPSARALEKEMQGTESFGTNQPEYLSALQRRNSLAASWKSAINNLNGYASPAVAKTVTDAWLKVEKEVRPLWKRRDKLEKRVDREYAKIAKMTGGEGLLPNKRYPAKVLSAQQSFLMASRKASEVRRDITDLATLQDALRARTGKFTDTSSLTWLLQNLIGSKKYNLAIKVEAIRAASAQGDQMKAPLIAVLDKAKKPDEIAAAVFGLAHLKDKVTVITPRLIELLDHQDAGVREQAALALQYMKAPESIEPLVQLVARERGLARKRIAAVLEILTGEQHGTNVSAWKRWFADKGADFAAGKVELGKGTPSAHDEFNKKNYYYGIPQDGAGIIYIIDCSGSMVVDKDNPGWQQGRGNPVPIPATNKKNSRSGASKEELGKALAQLSSDKTFNIIWYSHGATLFKKKMAQATPANIKAARKWIKGLPAYSSTNIYDALKLAFTQTGRGSFDSAYEVMFDQVFLMTDGKPTLQGLGDDDPMKIIEGARQWNSLKRVQIHTIAFGTKDINHGFMRMLADENGGEYRIVTPKGVKTWSEMKDKLPQDGR